MESKKRKPYKRLAKRGDLVQIHLLILQPEERAEKLPECTKRVPYEGWVKGVLLEEKAELGSTVHIRTFIGREITGKLESINPRYEHDFGDPQPELSDIGQQAWQWLAAKGGAEEK